MVDTVTPLQHSPMRLYHAVTKFISLGLLGLSLVLLLVSLVLVLIERLQDRSRRKKYRHAPGSDVSVIERRRKSTSIQQYQQLTRHCILMLIFVDMGFVVLYTVAQILRFIEDLHPDSTNLIPVYAVFAIAAEAMFATSGIWTLLVAASFARSIRILTKKAKSQLIPGVGGGAGGIGSHNNGASASAFSAWRGSLSLSPLSSFSTSNTTTATVAAGKSFRGTRSGNSESKPSSISIRSQQQSQRGSHDNGGSDTRVKQADNFKQLKNAMDAMEEATTATTTTLSAVTPQQNHRLSQTLSDTSSILSLTPRDSLYHIDGVETTTSSNAKISNASVIVVIYHTMAWSIAILAFIGPLCLLAIGGHIVPVPTVNPLLQFMVTMIHQVFISLVYVVIEISVTALWCVTLIRISRWYKRTTTTEKRHRQRTLMMWRLLSWSTPYIIAGFLKVLQRFLNVSNTIALVAEHGVGDHRNEEGPLDLPINIIVGIQFITNQAKPLGDALLFLFMSRDVFRTMWRSTTSTEKQNSSAGRVNFVSSIDIDEDGFDSEYDDEGEENHPLLLTS